MSKKKSLCGWKKQDIKDDFKELIKIVRKPAYICKKCGRASSEKDYLCKPAAIKK